MHLHQIRAGMAAAISDLGWSVYAAAPGHPDFPAVVIGAQDEILYHQSMTGLTRVTLTLTVMVSSADLDSAQELLNDAVSYEDGSLIVALESVKSDLWHGLHAVSAGQPFAVDVGESSVAFAAPIVVQLYAT